MGNLNMKELSGYSSTTSEENFDNISNYPEKDLAAGYGDVSNKPEDTWRTGLKLYDDEQTIFSSISSRNTRNQHQVCVIINDTSEEFDTDNNPIINPHNLERGANHRAEEETESAVATREKVHLTAAEWQTIKVAVNHGAVIPLDSKREVLMGYQYALHQQK
jgi:aromatic ring-opening dioxygenase LigB subunit